MAIRIQCQCGEVPETGEENAGRTGRCPKCGTVFRIPSAGAEATPPEHVTEAGAPTERSPGESRDAGTASGAYDVSGPPPAAEPTEAFGSAGVGTPGKPPPTGPGGPVAGSAPPGWPQGYPVARPVSGLMFSPYGDEVSGPGFPFQQVDPRLVQSWRVYDLQLWLHNSACPPVPRGLATAACVLQICGIVPYVGCLPSLAAVICQAVLVGKVQGAINSISRPYQYQYQYQQAGYQQGPPTA